MTSHELALLKEIDFLKNVIRQARIGFISIRSQSSSTSGTIYDISDAFHNLPCDSNDINNIDFTNNMFSYIHNKYPRLPHFHKISMKD